MPVKRGRSNGRSRADWHGTRYAHPAAGGGSQWSWALFASFALAVFIAVLITAGITTTGHTIDMALMHFRSFMVGSSRLLGSPRRWAGPARVRPHRDDPERPDHRPGRAPGRLVWRGGLPAHSHRDRNNRRALAGRRRRGAFPGPWAHPVPGAGHHRVRPVPAHSGDRDPAGAFCHRPPDLGMARIALRCLPGLGHGYCPWPAGRGTAKPYVDWSYGACVAAAGLALVVRLVAAGRVRETAAAPSRRRPPG